MDDCGANLMASKEFIVVFTKNNARIIMGGGMGAVGSSDRVVSSPDLSGVRGIPPHHWKLENGKIVPMDAKERSERDRQLDKASVGVNPTLAEHFAKQQRMQVLLAGLLALGISIVTFLLLLRK
jgi:hypothetical protein